MAEFKYQDDVFEHLTNEFEQIQTCAGMYIGSKGAAGAIHLFKEIFNNALDECNNPKSPADWIRITLYKAGRCLSVEDNGRGIPFDKMVEVCTEKHSGTKFGRKFNKESAGCNGVGLTVTVAFAKKFEMRCDRGNQYKVISFDECVLDDGPITNQKKERYGTSISFTPSEKWLGEFEFTDDDVLDWLRHMSYIIREEIKLEFVTLKDDKSVDYTRSIKASGLEANVRFLANEMEVEPIKVTLNTDELDLEMAFSYDKTLDTDVTDSYCNYVITYDGGYHEQACKYALSDFLVKECKNQDPNHKYEVIPDDVRKGLVMAINCRYANVVLGGQTKTKVENKEILKDGKRGIFNELKKYFHHNPDKLKKIISYLRQIAKIRLEANKIKGVKSQKVMSMYEESEIQDYWGITDRNHKGYAELIITEGKSAAGAINGVRNPRYQAVYTTTGVMKNTAELTMAQMMQSRIPRDLIKILGCGVGKDFNINNLRFNKIILEQDADADGFNIKCLLTTFFIVWLPDIVREGRLFSGVPPLYMLSDSTMRKYGKRVKGRNFLFDKREYTQLIHDIITDNVSLFVFDDPNTNPKNYKSRMNAVTPLSKGMFKAFLVANRKYLSELDCLVNKTGCHRDILELVCNHLIDSGLDVSKIGVVKHAEFNKDIFKKKIEKSLPEMTYDIVDSSIYGSYNSEDYNLIIDDLFISQIGDFATILAQNPGLYVVSKNKNDSEAPYECQTIGEFLQSIECKYDVDVEQRYKGLGDVDPELLFYSTLNPKVRKLIKLTMDDRDEALKSIMILRGSKYAESRRNILISKDIDDDDLDN